MVSLLMSAEHQIETKSSHLIFMLRKNKWFRESYIGLKVTASLNRNESCEKTIDGQIRCITATTRHDTIVVGNVIINVFIPAWTVPPNLP